MASMVTVSLKDALKFRPDGVTSYERVLRQNPKSKVSRLPAIWRGEASVICTPMWRPEDMRTFAFLTAMVCDADPKTRDQARTWLEQFQRKHGAEKCDMMLAELRRRDEEAWFADKVKLRGA